VGPELGSSLFASNTLLLYLKKVKNDIFQIDSDDFFKEAILYSSIQRVKGLQL